MRYFFTLFLILSFFSIPILGQQYSTFGKLTNNEKNLTVYERDSTAHAVVLYEKGNNYFKVINNRIRLIKEYHAKIKILDKKGFEYGTIQIPIYNKGMLAEDVTELKATTHNGDNQYKVSPSEIFETNLSERWTAKSFTFPKMQKGSILEYSYTLVTPFDFNFNGWDFQGAIPKIYSEFNAKIPRNWIYNRSLIGSLELDINDAHLENECFSIEGYSKSADCEVLKYAMSNIPAYKEEVGFMLAPENYRSRLDFELSQFNKFDGTSVMYTKSWNDVDREFRSDKDIGRQLTKKGFFERNVPEKLLTEGDTLAKAKNIYKFIQEHFSWNRRYSSYGEARVKEAFEAKAGNAWEINMSLINLLNAADIPTNLMLLSTRERALPKKTHPVMSDFNYIVAKTEINGKCYLLDATDKYMPFGMLPFRALNHYGRVMDFKNESYWYEIKPETTNKYKVRVHVKFNAKENNAVGIFDSMSFGYNAVDHHKKLNQKSKDEYLNSIEESVNGNFLISSYELVKDRTDEQKVAERFSFAIDNVFNEDIAYFNPFLFPFFNNNPFQLEERNYPIDLGFSRNYEYQINISVPEGYYVLELPKNKMITLGNNMATLKFYHKESTNQVAFFFDFALNSSYFAPTDYGVLKALFKDVIDIQKNSLVVIKKKDIQP